MITLQIKLFVGVQKCHCISFMPTNILSHRSSGKISHPVVAHSFAVYIHVMMGDGWHKKGPKLKKEDTPFYSICSTLLVLHSYSDSKNKSKWLSVSQTKKFLFGTYQVWFFLSVTLAVYIWWLWEVNMRLFIQMYVYIPFMSFGKPSKRKMTPSQLLKSCMWRKAKKEACVFVWFVWELEVEF